MDEKKIIILGWYGTETLGDKAILGGIIKDLIEKGGKESNIHLLSYNENYSRLTLLDLSYPDIKVSNLMEKKNDKEFLRKFDMFIMGGGPLCDIEDMIDVLEIFHHAKQLKKETIIHSCGVGPLNVERYRYVFGEILKNSDLISFRDYYTPEKYKKLIKEDSNYIVTLDPAIYYVRDIASNQTSSIIKEPYVMFCLRKWPRMYAYGIEEQHYNSIVEKFENYVVNLIDYIYKQNKKLVFFPMHNYFLGDDDREYYLDVVEKYNLWEKVHIIGHDYSINEAVNYFKFAESIVGMRFHSIVFSLALDTPCLSLDYQIDDGKITGLLNLLNIELGRVRFKEFEEPDFDLVSLFQKLETGVYNWKDVNEIISKQISTFKTLI